MRSLLRSLAPRGLWALGLILPAFATVAVAQDSDPFMDDLFLEDDMALGLDDLLDDGPLDLDQGPDAEQASALRSWKGFMEMKPRMYLSDRSKGRNDEQAILKAEFEMDFDFGDGTSGYFRPRIYMDLADGESNRFEPYEAYVSMERKSWDLRAGQFVENWGIVDTFNPIDVINRRDFGTDFLDTDRLGELGMRYRYFLSDLGPLGEPTVSLYALPIWQPTRFAGEDDRFGFGGGALEFDEDDGFEPEGLERGTYALRLQSTLSTSLVNADLQLLAARGPDRMPGFAMNPSGKLAPAYYGATTVGFGMRAVPNQDAMGDFLSTLTLKAEVIFKSPYLLDNTPFATPDDYLAFVVGVDRSFYDVAKDQDSVTLTVEYARESGANDVDTSTLRLFQNDLIVRGFWEANDFARTSFELRGIFDMEVRESVTEAIFETQLRSINEDLKFTLQAQYFDAADDGNTLLGRFPDNSSVAIGLRWDY